MTRHKRTNQQRLRAKKYKHVYCWVEDKTSTKGSHTKHGVWLHAKPLQQLQRWVVPFGHSFRKRHLKLKPRFLRTTWTYLPKSKYINYLRKKLWCLWN